jgi:SNF2 family DNA or RNA helicase
MLICDEAQVIKNPKAQAALVAQQLRTRYRLCLTGTPMENNLGELWSLFHFLMPGLLGDPAFYSLGHQHPVEPKSVQTSFLNDDNREVLTRPGERLLRERRKSLEQFNNIASLHGMFRHLSPTARRQRCHNPGRAAQF